MEIIMEKHVDFYPKDKEAMYALLAEQLKALMDGEANPIPNLANASSLIFYALKDINWAGVYLLEETTLVLGPFQGPLACSRIGYGRGVCGTAWQRGESIVVPDVDKFPGHIACSSASRSEIVVPVYSDGKVIAVLDIDSSEYDTFDDVDKEWLEKMVRFLTGGNS